VAIDFRGVAAYQCECPSGASISRARLQPRLATSRFDAINLDLTCSRSKRRVQTSDFDSLSWQLPIEEILIDTGTYHGAFWGGTSLAKKHTYLPTLENKQNKSRCVACLPVLPPNVLFHTIRVERAANSLTTLFVCFFPWGFEFSASDFFSHCPFLENSYHYLLLLSPRLPASAKVTQTCLKVTYYNSRKPPPPYSILQTKRIAPSVRKTAELLDISPETTKGTYPLFCKACQYLDRELSRSPLFVSSSLQLRPAKLM